MAAAEMSAEAIFDVIQDQYENAYGQNAGLLKVLNKLSDYISPGATVLDVGCGPGGPASYLANKGFAVTGLDISMKMIDFCKANVEGKFLKADMLSFEPEDQFSAIIVIFSLFQVSYRDTYTLLFKIASWLRPGGVVILGTIAAEDKFVDPSLLRGPGEYVEGYDAPFMGRMVAETLVTTRGWLKMIEKTGLSILQVDQPTFQPQGASEERQLFITARKIELEPVFGSSTLDHTAPPSQALSSSGQKPVEETH
jgi:2-polyprenyl-3-methyl-5-hydroxy-6-metoxy-1,4-benzoquinol methylase